MQICSQVFAQSCQQTSKETHKVQLRLHILLGGGKNKGLHTINRTICEQSESERYIQHCQQISAKRKQNENGVKPIVVTGSNLVVIYSITRMWANAQPDGRPAEHRWRPLFNAAKFG